MAAKNSGNVTIDLTNYRDTNGSRVDEGTYTVYVEHAEMDKSKAGNDMILLNLQIQGGEFDGQTLVDRLTLTDKALFRVVNFMQALGYPTPKKRVRINLAQFVGKYLQVEVEDGEPYMGRVKSEVRGYRRIAKDEQPVASAESDSDDLDDIEADEPETEEQEVEEKPKAKKRKSEPAPEADDDEDVDLDEIDEL